MQPARAGNNLVYVLASSVTHCRIALTSVTTTSSAWSAARPGRAAVGLTTIA